MATITIEVPDDLMEQLAPLSDQLPELLRQCLHQPTLPAEVYRHVLDFLTSKPSPEQIYAFRPTLEMQERLKTLLVRSKNGETTPAEQKELDEYERIEHLIVMLKIGNLPYLTQQAIS